MRVKIILFFILALTALLRIHTFQIPLERDEGEYAYAGQLILEGIPPYSLACNMKLPGTYAAHALNMALFGETLAGIHGGLLLWNECTILLMFLLGRKLFNPATGLAAAATYAWLSVSPSVMGTASHATQYVMLPAVAATLLLLKAKESERLTMPFLSGVLFGMAFLMKQHGMFFGIFGGLYLLWLNRTNLRRLVRQTAVYSLGAVLPFGLTCLILWRAGVFTKFWFWTFTYARAYASQASKREGFDYFTDGMQNVITASPALWALVAIGFILIWVKRETRGAALFVTVFSAFSFLAMCPGLFFREHYFVLILAAASLLAGAAIGCAPAFLRQPIPAAIFACVLAFSVYEQKEFFFQMNTTEASRDVWGTNPFPESIPISAYVRAHTSPTTRIAVLGSEPQIYFYSHRHSATGYLYVYGLMELQPYADRMHSEFIADILATQPQYVVWVNVGVSWGRREGSVMTLVDWWNTYGPAHYERVGVADMMDDHTEYRWDAAAATYKVQSEEYVTVLRRKL